MTKLQILQSYSNRRIRDSWYALGSNKITAASKIYTQNIIYQIDFKGSSLNGSLLFCKQDYIGNLDWTQCKVIDGNSGDVTFGNNIISPYFTFLLNRQDLEQISELVDLEFIPFKDAETTGTVKIPEDIYQICLRPLGSPFITEDELEYTRDQINELAIKPALMHYFKWFPKIQIEQVGLTGKEQEIQYPTGAYGVVDFSIQQGNMGFAGVGSLGEVSNPLLRYFDEMVYITGMGAGLTGNYSGTNAPTTQTSNVNSMLLSRASQQAYANYSHRYNLHTIIKEDGNRYLQFYSNKRGQAEIHWAMQTLDWNDTSLARRPELISLIEAEIKLLFANLRRQAKSDTPGLIDYNTWIAEANDTISKVTQDWQKIVKSQGVIRGSL